MFSKIKHKSIETDENQIFFFELVFIALKKLR